MNKGTRELINEMTVERELRFEQPTAHLRVGVVVSVNSENRPTVKVTNSDLPNLMTLAIVKTGDKVLVLMAGHLSVVLATVHSGTIAPRSGPTPGTTSAGGVPGPAGADGHIGPAGPTGHEGPEGPQGPPGHIGPAGPDGHVGPDGPIGPRGLHGLGIEFKGAKADEATIKALVSPELGEVHLDVSSGNLWVFDDIVAPHDDKTRATWHAVGHVQGPVGPAGPQGGKGDPGVIGHDGPAGHDGPQGGKGDPGPIGHDGPAGHVGAKGNPGAKGTTGGRGAIGPPGPKGATGSISTAAGDKRYLRIGAAPTAHTHPYLPIAGGTVTGATRLQASIVRNIWVYGSTPTSPRQGDIWMHS